MMSYEEFKKAVIEKLFHVRWNNMTDVQNYVNSEEEWVREAYTEAEKNFNEGHTGAFKKALNRIIASMYLDF